MLSIFDENTATTLTQVRVHTNKVCTC